MALERFSLVGHPESKMDVCPRPPRWRIGHPFTSGQECRLLACFAEIEPVAHARGPQVESDSETAALSADEAAQRASFAVMDESRELVRSTAGFRQRPDLVSAAGESPAFEAVLGGDQELAFVDVGETRVALQAVRDPLGRIQVMLSAPLGEPSGGDPLPGLRDELEASPLIAWVTDPEGRFVFANQRYLSELDVSPDRLLGHTGDELEPQETVDGPRAELGYEPLPDSPQLEYTVPAFERRQAIAAIRFVLRDGAGDPAGSCGLAAPLDQSKQVRDEAGRLMAIERISRMEPDDVRAELLRDWGLTIGAPSEGEAAPGESGMGRIEPHVWIDHAALANDPELAESWAACVQQLEGMAERWQAGLEQAQAAAEQATTSAQAAHDELDQVRTELTVLKSDLATERARNEELVSALSQVRGRIADLDKAVGDALPME